MMLQRLGLIGRKCESSCLVWVLEPGFFCSHQQRKCVLSDMGEAVWCGVRWSPGLLQIWVTSGSATCLFKALNLCKPQFPISKMVMGEYLHHSVYVRIIS